MKFRSFLLLIIVLCLSVGFLYAQEGKGQPVVFRSGVVTPEKNMHAEGLRAFTDRLNWVNGKTVAVLQFENIPSPAGRAQMAAAGIQLLDYLPRNSYTVLFKQKPVLGVLQANGVVAAFPLAGSQKIQPALARGILPAWAMQVQGKADLWISYVPGFTLQEVKDGLRQFSAELTSTAFDTYRICGIRLNTDRIAELANLPFIEYVQPLPHGDQQLNLVSRSNSRGNILNAATGVGGYDLSGNNVVIGVGDDGDPSLHVDFTGRLINLGSVTANNHGIHVNGTVGGAGHILEQYRGYAPEATLISQYFSGILAYAPAYVNDYDMVVTNNSYGDITGDCDYAGTYDLISRIMDLQAVSLPNLQHVFASGNDGNSGCPPYASGYKTVLGSYQSAKNVLVVGALEQDFTVSDFSSRGPVKDGRTKPEVMSYGRFLASTNANNSYGYNTGTSMASPGVAGGLALLYERYRQLNSGADPKNGLMKALVCNGATDIGNTGVDYASGYGSLNLLRSVDMLNNTRYVISAVGNSGSNTHNITVPANTAALKVMLYWNDPAASALAATTLVNDLDLELADPSASVHYPWLLDTAAANITNSATTGADHINNMEQVVINNPASGTFTATVKGTAVTQSPPQEYFLVYDIIPVSLEVSNPVGQEGWVPGEVNAIQWESYGNPANNFTVEYSTNNGSSWTTIDNNVAAGLRQINWTIPNVPTDQALIRVSKNGTGLTSTSQPFTILDVPTVSLAATQCEGYIAITWTAVPGATDYQVYQLTGSQMTVIATTTATSYTISGLSPSQTYWVSVRPRVNGAGGRRAPAISRRPDTGTCSGTISDNDLRLDALIAPVSGRIATSTALTATTTIQARIKNLDDAAVTDFDLRYRVNGGAWTTENVTATVNGGATYTHSFATTANFSAAGTYELELEVINQSAVDPVSANNTRLDTIKQILNDPVILPFTDDLETAAPALYYRNLIGVEGIERYDYARTFTLGRLSTFLQSGLSYSGSKSLLMDLDGFGGSGNTNYVTGTYNLTGLNAAVQDLRLDFQYKQHGDSVPHPDNSIWVRGDDTQAWVLAYTLSANGNEPGIFRKSPSIEVSDLLTANSQNFSSSFQVRFGQFGYVRIIGDDGFHGNSFDDIRLYTVLDDIQMIAIDTPVSNSCALSATTPVRVRVRNSSSATVNNIPIYLVVDGGLPVMETIGSIGADATILYTFAATADLSATGNHTIDVYVDFITDDFPDNDTATVEIVNSPLINSFPYLEPFESGNGNWYATGKNSSWAYGAPASTKINKAASGAYAWKTGLAGNYNSNELSYLYSPCFDVSAMTNPTLSFSIALDLEDCGASLCDGAYMEYSSDGISWTKLGAFGAGTNWYNKSASQLWSKEDYINWHVATTSLPTGLTSLRLRFVLSSDPFVNREGVAIDDIHIYDNTMGIYDGVTLGSPVNQSIAGGTNWIDFTSGGKLLLSVQPNNLNMGSTDGQVYINPASVRYDGNQYYHDRNITIKPATPVLADSVSVRFYFLDIETENLLAASGCPTCTKPGSAYELGVSKYSDTDDNLENGTIADNAGSGWLFIPSSNVRKIPFDKGYYAEFKVKDFSEFWLSNGGLDNLTTLPLQLIDFSARKANRDDVVIEWTTAQESNIRVFEVQVAKTEREFQNGQFIKIGELTGRGTGQGQLQYTFTDRETPKSGARYYRLKILDRDGSITYSAVKSVVFDKAIDWQVYPNPSADRFQLIHQINEGEFLTLKVFDAAGRLVTEKRQAGTGFVEKAIIDLGDKKYPAGLYLLETSYSGKKVTFRLIKN